MLKKLFLFLLAFVALVGATQVSIISVRDEDKHSSKEDFYHTFEYYVTAPDRPGVKCQATRIGKRWFATAAHCVKEICRKECTLQIDLLEQEISAVAIVEHSAEKSAVFVHPGFSAQTPVKNDFALFKADLRQVPLTYYMHTKDPNAPNISIAKEQFDTFLNKNREANSQYHRVLKPSFPPILVFDNGNYLLDRKLSVISIFNGKRKVKINPHPVYYVKDLGYAYTNNFGIRKGMSGSGVMTNTGELMGIISANMDVWYKKDNKKIQEDDYFMFPVFNISLIDFMRETMGSDFSQIDQKDAYPYAVNKTRKDFSKVVSLFKTSFH